MANLSSDFNSLPAVFVEDYYRVWRPQADDRRRLRAGKIVVAVCGSLCVAIAIVLAQSSGSALSLWYTVSAIVSGGLAGLFLLAFLIPRASAPLISRSPHAWHSRRGRRSIHANSATRIRPREFGHANSATRIRPREFGHANSATRIRPCTIT
jgi:Na+/proline symporter